MSVNIPTHFVEQYKGNLAHLLQIQGGKFRPYVTEAAYLGEAAAAVDQFGAVEMQEITGRFQSMGRVDIATDRVWIYPVDYSLPQMINTFDKLRLLLDPTDKLTQAALRGVQRQQDLVISDAFFADAKTGKSGGTTTAFDTTNHRVDAAIGAGADTGFNIDKLLAGIEMLENNNVDIEMEQPILAITPKQHGDLLRQTQVINTDYFSKAGAPILASDGRVKEIAGVKIIVSKLVPSNASYRLLPMWVPSGMHFGVWSDFTSTVSVRNDIEGEPYQLYVKMSVGATRLEAGRVIQIECTE